MATSSFTLAGADNGGTIKSCLLQHRVGAHGECTRDATQYTWQITIWAASLQTEVLARFRGHYGRDPRCNGTRDKYR